ARLRVSGLRNRRHGSDLDVAETESLEALHSYRVLVEAGSDTERRRERETESLHLESGIRLRQSAHDRGDRGGSGNANHEHSRVMRELRIHALQDIAEQ